MKKYLGILIVGLVLVSSQVFALPIATSNLTPFSTTSNVEGTLESNTTMFYLVEASNYTVVPTNQWGVGLRVDILPPGSTTTYTGDSLNSGAQTAYYIPVGTLVNSYFIQFDKVDISGNSYNTNLSASLTFGSDERILGLMTSTTSNNLADEFVGLSGFYYTASHSGQSRLETSLDTLIWGLNPDGTTTLDLSLSVANNNIDTVRVITAGGGAPVPEPATMLLVGSGLIGLAGIGRRKFFKK